MSADDNLRFDQRLYDELWNRGNLAAADSLIAPNVVYDDQPLGLDGYIKWIESFRRAMSDVHVRVVSQVADDTSVVSRMVWTGTHTGELLPHLLPGWPGPAIAPTGKSVTWTSMTMHRIVDGRLAEGWANLDLYGVLLQLGVIPQAAAQR